MVPKEVPPRLVHIRRWSQAGSPRWGHQPGRVLPRVPPRFPKLMHHLNPPRRGPILPLTQAMQGH